MRVLVMYDIADRRRRDRVANILLSIGVRIQFSVFDCVLRSESEASRLMAILCEIVNAEDDRLRVYRVAHQKRSSLLLEIGQPFEATLSDMWIV